MFYALVFLVTSQMPLPKLISIIFLTFSSIVRIGHSILQFHLKCMSLRQYRLLCSKSTPLWNRTPTSIIHLMLGMKPLQPLINPQDHHHQVCFLSCPTCLPLFFKFLAHDRVARNVPTPPPLEVMEPIPEHQISGLSCYSIVAITVPITSLATLFSASLLTMWYTSFLFYLNFPYYVIFVCINLVVLFKFKNILKVSWTTFLWWMLLRMLKMTPKHWFLSLISSGP